MDRKIRKLYKKYIQSSKYVYNKEIDDNAIQYIMIYKVLDNIYKSENECWRKLDIYKCKKIKLLQIIDIADIYKTYININKIIIKKQHIIYKINQIYRENFFIKIDNFKIKKYITNIINNIIVLSVLYRIDNIIFGKSITNFYDCISHKYSIFGEIFDMNGFNITYNRYSRLYISAEFMINEIRELPDIPDMYVYRYHKLIDLKMYRNDIKL